jgi:predicted nucleotidyltransferase
MPANEASGPQGLGEWVPEVIRVLVEACNPTEIVLFGSVARGEAGSDSDIDLLVVIDDTTDWASAGKAAIGAVARLAPDVDVVVATQTQVEANRDRPGTVIRPALSEGRVVYARAA